MAHGAACGACGFCISSGATLAGAKDTGKSNPNSGRISDAQSHVGALATLNSCLLYGIGRKKNSERIPGCLAQTPTATGIKIQQQAL